MKNLKYYLIISILLLTVGVILGWYWHADPKKYKPTSIIQYPGRKKKMAINVWKRDNKKKLEAAKWGFRVIYLWQDDIHKMNDMVLVETVMKSIKTERPIQRLKE